MNKIEKILINKWTMWLMFIFSLLGPVINMERTDNIQTVASFFLMFIILKVQDKQEKAILLKLDALIEVSPANNQFIKIEEDSEEVLQKKEESFKDKK